MANNLVVCNRGTEPTIATRRASSIIDITLCSSSLFNKIMDWRVNKGPYYSDHNRILFSLSTETTPTERSWVLKSADWGRFRDLMRQSSQKLKQPEYWTPDTVECATAQFYRDIEFSLSKVSPRIRAGRRYTNKWWNDNLTKLRRETRNLQKRAMVSRDDESLWTRYKRSRNSLVAAIRKAKRDTWRSFTEEASSPESMIKLTKALFKKGGRTVGHLRRPDGTFTQSREEILDTLMDSFFPDSIPVREASAPHKAFVFSTEVSALFSKEKIAQAFGSFKKKKAPGPDGLRPEVLHNLDSDSLGRLSHIYGACLCLGFVPGRWRKSKAVLIPKASKRDYCDPRAFRPISLTSFLFKGMERVILWHLEELGITDKLSRNQHAFRKNHSTETILSEAVDLIEQNVLRHQHTLGVFFDIEGAFDNVLLDKVIEGLKSKEVPRDITEWYGYYLTNRSVKITLGSSASERSLVRGTPQGGILSPLVWNIVFDSLLELLERFQGVNPRGYADDGMFLISGISPEVLIDLAQPAVNQAVEWGKQNGLRFSTKKTQAILFTRSKKLGNLKRLRINGNEIPYSDKIDYLGVTLTHRLRWDAHIKAKINKAKAKLFQLRTATGVTWGPSPKAMIWAFNSIIVPSVTYGALVWGHREFPTKVKHDLGKLNRLATVGLSPIVRSTPTAGLEAIMGLKPLDLVIKEAGLAAYWRWRPRLKWTGWGRTTSEVGHLLAWSRVRALQGVQRSTLNRSVLTFNWDPPCFLASIKEADAADVKCVIRTTREASRTLFCYHICNRRGEAWTSGTLVVEGQESNSLYKGLEIILGTLYREVEAWGKVSVIMRHRPLPLLLPRTFDQRTRDLLGVIRDIRRASGMKVAFAMPKKSRKNAAGTMDNCPTYQALTNQDEVRKLIHRWGNDLWQERWDNSTSYRQTKEWLPRIGMEDTLYFRNLSRVDLGKAIRLLTGHNGLKRHMFKVCPEVTDSDCRLCGEEEEDSTHLWARCLGMVYEGWNASEELCNIPCITPRWSGDRVNPWTRSQLSRFLRIPIIASLLTPTGGQ